MAEARRVLVFVEDPGAANFVAGVVDELRESGESVALLAKGAGSAHLERLGQHAESIRDIAAAEEVLKTRAPDLLIVGTSENPNTLGLELVEAARRLGIPSAGVVDAVACAAYRFRGDSSDPLAFAPDWILVPDESVQRAFLDLGYPGERLLVVGHPHHDHVLEERARLEAIGKDEVRRQLLPAEAQQRFVIVFLAELSSGLDPDQFRRTRDYTLVGRGNSQGRTEIVIEELLDVVSDLESSPYLVLRLHPKNVPADFEPYLEEFHFVSSDEPPLELAWAADLVVGLTTMLLLEAAILGTPTLSVVPREAEKVRLATLREGVTPCVFRRQDLRSKVAAHVVGEGDETRNVRTVLEFGARERAVARLREILERS